LLRFVALFSFIVLSLSAAAAERIDVYTTTVQVETQQEADRNVAFSDALKQVIVKVTGDEQFLDKPELDALFEKSRRYVAGFSYQKNVLFDGRTSSDNADEVPVSEGKSSAVFAQSLPEKEYLLKVQFEGDALLNHIRELGLPVWGALRPSIIAWVVMQENGERHLVNSDYPALSASLNRESERAGLPVYLPVGDLQDLSSVDLNELWGLFPSSVQAASERYPSDFKLLGRVYQAEEGLELKWTLLTGGSAKTGGAKSVDYPSLWRQMTAGVAKELAQQFAVVSDPMADAQELRILVSGVEQFLDYASLVEHLESLSSVEEVSVQQIYQDKVGLGIGLRGSRANFEQQVSLAGKLQMVVPPFSAEPENVGFDGLYSTEEEQLAVVEPIEVPISLNFYWVPGGGA
jgi:uncharacterized protein